LKYQFLSEQVLSENLERLTKQNLWALVLKTQKLSYEFLIDHIDSYKNDKRIIKAIKENAQLDDSIKFKILVLLDICTFNN